MCGEFRLAPEFDALCLRVGAASCRALHDATAFQLCRNAKDRKKISAKSELVSRKGSASERMPAPTRCISRAIIRRSAVWRCPVPGCTVVIAQYFQPSPG
jgi:hypothetical protein